MHQFLSQATRGLPADKAHGESGPGLRPDALHSSPACRWPASLKVLPQHRHIASPERSAAGPRRSPLRSPHTGPPARPAVSYRAPSPMPTARASTPSSTRSAEVRLPPAYATPVPDRRGQLSASTSPVSHGSLPKRTRPLGWVADGSTYSHAGKSFLRVKTGKYAWPAGTHYIPYTYW